MVDLLTNGGQLATETPFAGFKEDLRRIEEAEAVQASEGLFDEHSRLVDQESTFTKFQEDLAIIEASTEVTPPDSTDLINERFFARLGRFIPRTALGALAIGFFSCLASEGEIPHVAPEVGVATLLGSAVLILTTKKYFKQIEE